MTMLMQLRRLTRLVHKSRFRWLTYRPAWSKATAAVCINVFMVATFKGVERIENRPGYELYVEETI